MSIIKGNHAGLGGAGAPGGALGSFFSHTIDQSLRLNRADSAHLSKTWSSAADSNQVFTFSIWVKRHGEGDGSNELVLIQSKNTGSGTGQGSTLLGFYRGSNILYYTENGGRNARSKALYRDCGAWMHLCWQYDSTQSTAEDRIKIYVNGVHLESGSTNWTSAGFGFPEVPALNSVMTSMNQNTQLNAIGAGISTSINYGYFDGYIAEVIMLDGVSTDCTSFGEFKDGIWIPKAYSGSFGTNGYHLDFADSSAIGNDVSGNNNDWTANNLATSDVVPDSPTNNFATLNPLFNSVSQAVLSEGNLKAATAGFSSSAYGYGATSTFAIPKDKKIYIEVEDTGAAGDNWFAGFATKTSIEAGPAGNTGGSGAITVYNRSVKINGTETDYGSSAGLGGLGVAKLAAGDILGCAIDGATGKVWFSRNGTYFKSPTTDDSGTTGNPSAGSNEIGTLTGGTTDDVFFVLGGGTSADNIFVNFGQDSVNVSSAAADANGLGTFEYAPPTDYVCLAASSLSDPTIGPGQSSQADDNFNTVLYTGNGSTQSITGVGFQPDWTWIKNRAAADAHALTDSVRGVTKELQTNAQSAESTNADGLTAFGADGFSLGDDDIYNTNTETYVSWNWKAGGAPSGDNSAANNAEPTAGSAKIDGSNQSGAFSGSPSIAIKRLSASTTAGFSIVQWTGTGSAGTIPHGLGAAPHFYVVKNLTDDSTSWQAYHRGIASDAETDYIYLNSNAAAGDADDWNDTAPTANVFSVKTHNQVNASGDEYVAYLFTSIEGFSKHASYVGNGSTDGTFVYTGFRPAFLLIGKTAVGGGWNWQLRDSVRGQFNPDDNELRANSNAAESSSSAETIDFLSNGFKPRSANGATNENSYTYIYLAFAEAPFKFANAR